MAATGKVRVGNMKGVEMNQQDVATLFGVTPNSIRQWRFDGMPTLGMIGREYMYDSAACVKWKNQRDIDEVKNLMGANDPGNNERMTHQEAKTRREIAQALMAELDLAKAREQVANIDDLMANFSDALVAVRAKVISQPSRLAGILAHQEEEEIFDILTKDVEDALTSLVDYDHEYVGDYADD